MGFYNFVSKTRQNYNLDKSFSINSDLPSGKDCTTGQDPNVITSLKKFCFLIKINELFNILISARSTFNMCKYRKLYLLCNVCHMIDLTMC